jgi:hypothetical protein
LQLLSPSDLLSVSNCGDSSTEATDFDIIER